MLDSAGEVRTFLQELKTLPCEVTLPEGWEAEAISDIREIAVAGDRRRHTRRALRSIAAMKFHSVLPALPRESKSVRVYTKDISCSGMAFFHSEQLYPMERMDLSMVTRSDNEIGLALLSRTIEVTRCIKTAPARYEIGARFTKLLS